ncbi:hypothetical protein HG531_011661 [Fusarium graminearum]|nr:hypothetical protein HG531_011661 [Fusarium graminearum]
MVFPIGARIREIAADHLDRLPGKSLIDGLVQKCGVTKDSHARCADEPEQGRERRGNQTQRHGDTNKCSVKLRTRGTKGANFKIVSIELSNEPHAHNHKDDVEEQQPVGQEGINAEHNKNNGIVAGVVAQVVVDSRLHLNKVVRLGETLEVEELVNRSQVREAAAERSGSEALEAVAKVEARRNNVERDLNARHDGRVVWCR